MIAGMGPFDWQSFAEVAGIELVMTTTSTTTSTSFANLVEYCWGNSSTPMGAKRVADGHRELYKIFYFELVRVKLPQPICMAT
jgi:alpha-L-arabinofuranosidase